MKRLFTIFLVLMTMNVFIPQESDAQAPQKMSYQAIIRDVNNKLVLNQTIGMQISILKDSTTGTIVYNEMQTPTTNSNGLISIQIGGDTAFSSIDWSTGSYFIKTEIDPIGGTSYSISGNSQLLSVPYSLYAVNAGKTSGHYVGELFGGGIVFWVSPDRQHGLVMSLQDISSSIIWTNSKTITGANDLYDGSANTNKIIAVTGSENNAALVCKNYRGGGFSDWFLPSAWQLRLLYNNAYTLNYVLVNDNDATSYPLVSSGLIDKTFYWSSTEYSDNFGSAAYSAFSLSYPSASLSKTETIPVRAVRAF